MRKYFLILSVSVITLFAFVEVCSAGLINYNRRNKKAGVSATGTRTATRATRATTPRRTYQSTPKVGWMAKAPRVRNRTEKRYDTNRDGKLQQAEVKVFLRDVIQVVNSRGSMKINSNILQDYDKNGDGKISRYEIDLLQRHLR